MIRHILRMVWNRKKSNVLIWLEILVSFLVVFALSTFGVYLWHNAQLPLGYSIDGVWELFVQAPDIGNEEAAPARKEKERQLLRELRGRPEIEAVSVTHFPPFRGWSSRTSFSRNEEQHEAEVIRVDLGHPDVFGLNLLAGRFFEEGDATLAYLPVVINQHLAEEIFGTDDPIGQRLRDPNPDDPGNRETRVIGIFDDYRKGGPFERPGNVLLYRFDHSDEGQQPLFFVGLKLQPGTPAQFEERIMEHLEAFGPTWTFRLTSLADQAESDRRLRLGTLLVAGLVAGFLLAMVTLGLLGVLWQAVTQRMKEIGVRRAKGAIARQIYTQILGELFGVTLLALLAGTLLIVQLPLTGWLDFLTSAVTVPAYLLAVAVMLALTAISGWYPSRIASSVHPAEALHYE